MNQLRVSDEELQIAKEWCLEIHSEVNTILQAQLYDVVCDLQDTRRELRWALKNLLYAEGDPKVLQALAVISSKYGWADG